MQCRNCGIPLRDGTTVCPNCGTAVPPIHNTPAPGSYEPTILATPSNNYPNQQMPPTNYGSAPPPPPSPYGNAPNPYQDNPYQQAPQPYPYQTPPPYQPGPGQQPNQQPRKRSRVGLIVGIVILVLVLICAGGGILTVVLLAKAGSSANQNGYSTTTQGNATTTVSTPTLAPTTATQGGSGGTISPDAAAIITGVTTAKSVNTTTAAPIEKADTFAVNQTVYVTFTLDSNKHDFVQQPGYVEVKFYGGSQFIGKRDLQIDRVAPGGYFTAVYYTATTGYAELYWCTQANCSDEQLAQVATFTVA